MWLINAETYKLEDFSGRRPLPYAILSHTWGDGEVSFQDMSSADRLQKQGYAKIETTCKLAREYGLRYAWVDSCCIIKLSSAELSEAINSMFRWYKKAAVCFVYLADLNGSTTLARCRWFKRGFTLQELIAPARVEFFDNAWKGIGTKVDLCGPIERITGIPSNVLCGMTDVSQVPVARRMSWAARRRTTRAEDVAYCLLGIFGVNMPLLYGEGPRAFRRLQEEIVKQSDDLTLFAWQPSLENTQPFIGLFAPSPREFLASSDIRPFVDDFANFSITSKRLHLMGDIPLRIEPGQDQSSGNPKRYVLYLGTNVDGDGDRSTGGGGIYLRKIGPNLFCRIGDLPLCGFDGAGSAQYVDYNMDAGRAQDILYFTDIFICLEETTSMGTMCVSYRWLVVHVDDQNLYDGLFRLQCARPEMLWDAGDNVFLRTKTHKWIETDKVLVMVLEHRSGPKPVRVIVLFAYGLHAGARSNRLLLFSCDDHPREAAIVLQQRYREIGMTWDELILMAPNILDMSDHTDIVIEESTYRLQASTIWGSRRTGNGTFFVQTLCLESYEEDSE